MTGPGSEDPVTGRTERNRLNALELREAVPVGAGMGPQGVAGSMPRIRSDVGDSRLTQIWWTQIW